MTRVAMTSGRQSRDLKGFTGNDEVIQATGGAFE
jgi:hypothetical protein